MDQIGAIICRKLIDILPYMTINENICRLFTIKLLSKYKYQQQKHKHYGATAFLKSQQSVCASVYAIFSKLSIFDVL